MPSNQLTIVVVRSEVEVGIKVREVDMVPEVHEELGCYHWVYVSLHFIKQDGVDNREDHVGVELDPDEENIDDVFINDDRELHWCMVSRTTMDRWMG